MRVIFWRGALERSDRNARESRERVATSFFFFLLSNAEEETTDQGLSQESHFFLTTWTFGIWEAAGRCVINWV